MNLSDPFDALLDEYGHFLYFALIVASLVFIGLMLAWRKPPVPQPGPIVHIILVVPPQGPPPRLDTPPVLDGFDADLEAGPRALPPPRHAGMGP